VSNTTLLHCVAVLVLFAASCAHPAGAAGAVKAGATKTEGKVVRLLTIGNSFAGNATRYLEGIAEAAGDRVILGRANIGGASMERHWRAVEAYEADPDGPAGKPYLHSGARASLKEMLQLEPWDVVTIQQFSWLSYDAQTYRPYARKLYDYVRRNCPGAQVRIHETWAYRGDELRPGYSDQQTLHADIRAAYHTIAGELGIRILPVGDAFNAVRSSPEWQRDFRELDFDSQTARYPELPDQTHSLCRGWVWQRADEEGEWQLRRDTHHANAAGCYLGACVFYECLFGKSVVENSFVPPEIDPQDARFLRRVAHETARDPQNVTPATPGDTTPS